MSALPELPKPMYGKLVIGTSEDGEEVCDDSFSTRQMRKYATDYGDARAAHARNQALEEAAHVCETQIDPTRPCTTSGFAYWHAKQIKELLK
jgi:hypothetical protein